MSGFQQAIEYFQQATTTDLNYAPAYAGLANSYALLTAYTSASATLYMPQARAAALRALEIDEGLAEAHAALALIVQNQDWDWQTSEKEYRRAIELNPNYATAHQWYAEHLMWLGRFDEALSESERARQLDPLSLIIAADYGAILYYSRQYDRAIEQFRAVLRKDPNFVRAGLISNADVEKAMFAQALADAEILPRLYGEGPWHWSVHAYIYGRAGQPERARRELEKLEKVSRHEQLDPVTMLWAHLGMGDKEEALADLEKAGGGFGRPGKGILRALRYSDHPQGRTGLRSAAQRPALPGLIAARRPGHRKTQRWKYLKALTKHRLKIKKTVHARHSSPSDIVIIFIQETTCLESRGCCLSFF